MEKQHVLEGYFQLIYGIKPYLDKFKEKLKMSENGW